MNMATSQGHSHLYQALVMLENALSSMHTMDVEVQRNWFIVTQSSLTLTLRITQLTYQEVQ